MKQPKYYEAQGTKDGISYLFSKRLNPKHGTYPLFTEKLKRKLAATTEPEAAMEARALAGELDWLQQVCLKDAKNLPLSQKDMGRATKTWLTEIAGVNLSILRQASNKNTLEAIKAKDELSFLISEVGDHFIRDGVLSSSTGPVESRWLTTFGDHLLSTLKGAETTSVMSDAIAVYLKQTQRDHLPDNFKSVADTRRYVNQFIVVAGDKPIGQITRNDVARYIEHRLTEVKTTSVKREIGTLRSVWQKAALVADVKQLNPFAEQPIKGLGTDSVKRKTPSIEETKALLLALEKRYAKLPESYVSALAAVAALTGLRLSEAWGLEPDEWERRDDLRFCGILHIHPNDRRTTLKNRNSVRPFPVLPQLAVWLDRLFKTQPAKTANSASAGTLSALKLMGFDFGNHSLRHGFKQRLIETDTLNQYIDELQGWSRQSMAKNYGYETVTAHKVAAVKRVYDLLLPEESSNVVPLFA